MLAGIRAYQDHSYYRDLPDMPEIGHAKGSLLRDYGGSGPPVVFVPSPINPPSILDLAADNSLLRWLATQGVRPLLVDWGPDDGDWRAADLDELVARLGALIRGVGEPVAVAGYCLGGTLTLALPARVAVTRIALLATPWRFAGYGDAARADIAKLAAATRPLADRLGAYPVELLQPGFWALDRAGVAAKFEAFAALDPASFKAAAFVALEDWTNTGTPLPLRVAHGLFDDLFAHDCSGLGRWRIGGRAVDPARFAGPILDVVATRDRIVPAASALGLGERLAVDAGHVGMIVGSRARDALWQPLARFLRGD